MAKAKKAKRALKKKAAPANKAARQAGRQAKRGSVKRPTSKPTKRGASKATARKTATRKKPTARPAKRAVSKSKAPNPKALKAKAKAPKTVTRKAPVKAVKVPIKKTTKLPAPHRLPPSQRHAVEVDDPRERAGDANEKAFVGTDTEEDEAKELGEEFVRSVTSGEEAESEMEEEEAVEEQGGPFLITSARTEYGFGTDASNPADAEKSPFPKVSPAVSPTTDGEEEDQ